MSTQIEELTTQALSVPERAKMIVITDAASYTSAGETLKAIKQLRFEIESTFKPIRESAHATWKAAIRQQEIVEQPLEEAEQFLKPKIAGYLREEERKRHDEEIRLQKIARDREETERLERASILHDVGETAMANQVLEEVEYVPPVILPSAAPKVAGISMRETWDFDIIDMNKIPREFLVPDLVKIRGLVRAMKGATNIPGIRAKAVAGISAGRR